ncbi:E3 ubiquitin-protein ligase TRIM7-like [Onychomys torridus]|uniref:E3 ubiquitin-protein ligase TRIM7-like n=1 Tax=Onychomys torridus TaxID=38674 RepID=UPI00167FAD47|nr:E3 ubiquitin-protein ligase TRIM7-like [Onychomys torridus]
MSSPTTFVRGSEEPEAERADLQAEAHCPVCKKYFKDPVTIECGHNFCLTCIRELWKDLKDRFPCPVCHFNCPERSFQRNEQLGKMTQGATPLPERKSKKRKLEEECSCETRQKLPAISCQEDQQLPAPSCQEDQQLPATSCQEDQQLQPLATSCEEDQQLLATSCQEHQQLQPLATSCQEHQQLQPLATSCQEDQQLQLPATSCQEDQQLQLPATSCQEDQQLQLLAISCQEDQQLQLPATSCQEDQQLQLLAISWEEDQQLPATCHQEDQQLPATSCQEDQQLPATSRQEDQQHPATSRQEDQQHPATSCQEDQQLPATSCQEDQQLQLPATSRQEDQQLPATSCQEDQQLPATSCQEDQQLPATSCQEDQQLPATSCQEDQQLPATSCQEDQQLQLPATSCQEDQQLPATSCQEDQQLPATSCQEDQEVPRPPCSLSSSHTRHCVWPIEDAARCPREYIEWYVKLWREKVEPAEKILATQRRRSLELKKWAERRREELTLEYHQYRSFLHSERQNMLEQLQNEESAERAKLQENLAKFSDHIDSLKCLWRKVKSKYVRPELELLTGLKDCYERPDSLKCPGILSFELKEYGYRFPPQCAGLDRIIKRFHVNVLLDPKTAHYKLKVSEDKKTVQYGGGKQRLPYSTQRFRQYPVVLGSEGYSSGRQYWEVDVACKYDWMLGVCKEPFPRSRPRNSNNTLQQYSVQDGLWGVGLNSWENYFALGHEKISLLPNVAPSRVGIFLDSEMHEVSFYNLCDKSLLYSFSDCASGALWPYFYVGCHFIPLKICTVKEPEP